MAKLSIQSDGTLNIDRLRVIKKGLITNANDTWIEARLAFEKEVINLLDWNTSQMFRRMQIKTQS